MLLLIGLGLGCLNAWQWVAKEGKAMADTRQHASEAFDLFIETYEAKYPKPATATCG